MTEDNGRPGGPSQAEPVPVSALRASVPDAWDDPDKGEAFMRVQAGCQRLMELDREAGGDLCVAIGQMRAVELGIGRNNVAPIWRRGVGDAVSAVDVLLREWKKSKLRSRRDAAAELDPILQAVHDARLLRSPGSYAEACEAGDVLRAQAMETRRAGTEGSGAEHDSAVSEGNAP